MGQRRWGQKFLFREGCPRYGSLATPPLLRAAVSTTALGSHSELSGGGGGEISRQYKSRVGSHSLITGPPPGLVLR